MFNGSHVLVVDSKEGIALVQLAAASSRAARDQPAWGEGGGGRGYSSTASQGKGVIGTLYTHAHTRTRTCRHTHTRAHTHMLKTKNTLHNYVPNVF